MNKIATKIISGLILLCFPNLYFSQKVNTSNQNANTMHASRQKETPEWLLSHIRFLTQGDGYWVADNSMFMSKDEPFDEYAIKWTLENDGKVLTGRMTSLKDKKVINSPMTVRVFWDLREQKALVYQIMADNSVGIGEIRNIEGNNKIEREVDEVFYSPLGGTFRALHKMIEQKDQYIGLSFFLIKGSWNPHRSYTWKSAALQ
ncbi:MAG: hypothetical protein R2747_18670 [Pyrinomonadaceae bacterium]